MPILVIYRQCGFWIIPINTGNNKVWIFALIALRWGSSKFIFRVNDLLKLQYKIPYKILPSFERKFFLRYNSIYISISSDETSDSSFDSNELKDSFLLSVKESSSVSDSDSDPVSYSKSSMVTSSMRFRARNSPYLLTFIR